MAAPKNPHYIHRNPLVVFGDPVDPQLQDEDADEADHERWRNNKDCDPVRGWCCLHGECQSDRCCEHGR